AGILAGPTNRTSLEAATAEKPGPLEVGPEFGTLAGPASRRDLIGQQSGPNSQSWPSIGQMPVAHGASRTRQKFRKVITPAARGILHFPADTLRMEEQFNRQHGATARAFSEGQNVLVRDYSGRRPTWSPELIPRRRCKVLYEIQVCPAKMEEQFNRQHGATARAFSEGQNVLVRDYSGRRPTWSPELIPRRRCKVLYEIQVCPAKIMSSDRPVDLYVELNSDCNAIGSTVWDYSGHQVTFSVYGPDEVKSQDELTHRARVDILVLPSVGQHTLKETELEAFLTPIVERLVDVKAFPRSKISGRLCILSGDASHPQTVAAALNAISLSLLQSGLPLRATISAVCLEVESKPLDHFPAVFAIFTGSSAPTSHATGEPGFTFLNLLNILALPVGGASELAAHPLYSRALDLANVMVTQLGSVHHIRN
ncbi:hypothetical protein T265_14833, partial [Opisthorchis viverrini]